VDLKVGNCAWDKRLPFITPEPGAYILLIFLPEQQSTRVGSLGEIDFVPGWSAYVGSAMRGLRSRISRHLKRDKKIFWHIDYLLKFGVLKEIITVKSRQKLSAWFPAVWPKSFRQRHIALEQAIAPARLTFTSLLRRSR
jgi:hypothetical protein